MQRWDLHDERWEVLSRELVFDSMSGCKSSVCQCMSYSFADSEADSLTRFDPTVGESLLDPSVEILLRQARLP